MKTAIAAKGKELSSEVDERFGRAAYFLITDEGGENIEEIIENTSKNNPTGAGTGAASLIAEKGALVLMAGNLGPKAEDVINAAGIKFISFAGKVSDAIQAVKGKDMKSIESGQSSYADQQNMSPQNSAGGMGRGMGQGQGRGMGQGKGMCQGQGKGMGGGQGRGGCGGGRGMGRGAGKGMGRNSGRM